MIAPSDPAIALTPVTDGAIAAINLRSARLQSWSRFWRAPERPGIAEAIVEQELLTAQFLGDAGAFDRLETLVNALVRADPDAARTSLVAAQVACATHRFGEAAVHLADARARGGPPDATDRLALSLDQATGTDLDRVLATRRARAAESSRWEELVPLGALLADHGAFGEAEAVYYRALKEYRDASPFALGWVCFELGMLWGERVPEPRATLAAEWYRRAIGYLPSYVKARVHLAEILHDRGANEDARALLEPAMESGDPEVPWRLAEAVGTANQVDAEKYLELARSSFDSFLARHPLAFADHAAEFFLGSGSNSARAFALAQLNVANRPTPRAFALALKAALAAGDHRAAKKLVAEARRRWTGSAAFASFSFASPLDIDRDGASGDRLNAQEDAAHA
jgi:tetratricopeptide (TPR) repeat protein